MQTLSDKPNRRDLSVDATRGLAIVIMAFANMGPLLNGSHSFPVRVIESLAAPIFIFLAGLMLPAGLSRGHSLRYYLSRGAFILLLGILIDVAAWGILPLTTVDALYLIGVGVPIAAVFLTAKPRVLLGAIALILAATPILQSQLGYADYPNEWLLSGKVLTAANTPVTQHWFVDGWFPLFPWLSYLLAGVLVGQWRWSSEERRTFGDRKFALTAVTLLLAGTVLWWAYPGPMMARHGFSELFYPPTPGFVLFSWGAVGVTLLGMDRLLNLNGRWTALCSKASSPFVLLGSCSMLMYVAHALVIGKAYSDYWDNKADERRFLLLYLGLMVALFAVAWAAKWLRRKWTTMPAWAHWIIGG